MHFRKIAASLCLFGMLVMLPIMHTSALNQEDVGYVNATQYNVSFDAATLNAAISGIGSANRTLFLEPGTWILEANVSVPNNIILWIPNGTTVSVNSSKTLTTYRYRCENVPCFSGSGTVVLHAMDPVNARDFGVLDSVSNNSPALAAWLASGGKHLYLPAGTYIYRSTLKDTMCNRIIHGDGAKASILSFEPSSYSSDNDTGLWIGNSTQDLPSPIYACERPILQDIGVQTNTNARIAVRFREVNGGVIERAFFGAKDDNTSTDLTSLLIDGAINSTFNNLELNPKNGSGTNTLALRAGPSLNLAHTAGSGSGAGFTSSKFRDTYLHYANTGALLSHMNEVTFENVIVEAINNHGVDLYDPFLGQFLNGYYEAIGGPVFTVHGLDTRNHAQIIVRGGFYNAGMKSGWNSDSFVSATYATRIRVEGVQMFGNLPIGQIIQATNTDRIELDAIPYTFHVGRLATSETSLSNAIATTNGSPNVLITKTAHGLSAGWTIGLKDCTTPINGIPVNQPFYRVASVVDANTISATPLYYAPVATATRSALGGTCTFLQYDAGVWANPVLVQPEVTTLLDAPAQTISYKKNWTAAADNQPLFVNGGDGEDFLYLDSWTYLLDSKRTRSIPWTTVPTCYAYIYADLPSGYEQNLLIGALSELAIGTYASTTPVPVGFRLPPGTRLRVRMWSANNATDGNTRTETVTLRLAPTLIRTVKEP